MNCGVWTYVVPGESLRAVTSIPSGRLVRLWGISSLANSRRPWKTRRSGFRPSCRPGRELAYYDGVRDALGEVRNAPPPTEEQWGAYVEAFVTALEPLGWAGWDVPDVYESDFDKVHGPCLTGRLSRTCMAVEVEYDCWTRELRLLPAEDDDATWLSILEDEVTIALSGTADDDRAAVSRQTGALGLLDPTVLKAGPDSDVSTADLLADLYAEWGPPGRC